MLHVKIVYSTGLVEEVNTSANSLKEFVNEKFGSAYDAFVEAGGVISIVGEDPAPEVEDVVASDAADAEDDAQLNGEQDPAVE